jgi:hypothetical protein
MRLASRRDGTSSVVLGGYRAGSGTVDLSAGVASFADVVWRGRNRDRCSIRCRYYDSWVKSPFAVKGNFTQFRSEHLFSGGFQGFGKSSIAFNDSCNSSSGRLYSLRSPARNFSYPERSMRPCPL